MSGQVDFSSSRARKARFSSKFDSSGVRAVLRMLAILCFVGWIAAVYLLHVPAGHLLLIPASISFMVLAWYKGELGDLAVSESISLNSALDQIIERKLLGRLRVENTPAELSAAAAILPGGIFFTRRYGIAPETLAKLLADETDTTKVWSKAIELTIQIGGSEVDAAVLTAALMLSVPNYSFYLAQLQLDSEDIISGLHWHAHIKQILAGLSEKKGGGGIGRDLSFGWAPLLNQVGVNISESVQGGILHRQVDAHQDALSQIAHLLGQPGRRNATLVGEVGVGKTTLVYALADQLMSSPKTVSPELRYRQIIELDASHLISRAKGRGELESLLIRLFNEAIHAKNIIIFLDEAQLFLQDGVGSVDLSSVLLPILQGGALQIIIALSDQEWLKLSQSNPGLAQLMNRVVVNPLGESDALRVMEDQVLLLETRNPVVYMHHSLTEAYKLADRFIRDQAFPGKGIRLLEAAAGFPEQQHFITEKSVQQAVEKSFDVKVQVASSADERDVLLNLEGRIHERMINQTRAVQVVSDALRRARAGVRNQNKPIGTFLFLGPTGVGKTELAKALAATYFGGEDRIIRLDLNEYSGANDVGRIIATPSQYANSLCALVSKQPFSVILLDEIEKAHQSVLDVLLQLLDEGVLRDAENKPVSFRDAIVIATSNAGADKIRSHIEAGESLEQFEDQFIDDLISSNIFRPEFINRFDETVLFRPLTVNELKQIVDLILVGINKTLSSQKVAVTLTEGAKQLLAERGYDPRLGARPLRRVTQRSIENILAQKLLSGEATPGSTIQLDTPEIESALQLRT